VQSDQHTALVIAHPAGPLAELLLQEQFPGLQLIFNEQPTDAECERATILLGAPDQLAKTVARMPQLVWVQSTWAGVEPLIAQPKRDFILTALKGVFGAAMSEYVLGWLIFLERNLMRQWHASQWQEPQMRALQGRKLGILGTGTIAQEVARTAQTLGIDVIGLNRDGRTAAPFTRCYSVEQKSLFADQLDYVVALLPDTPSTLDLIDTAFLRKLAGDSILINAGRGNCVDEGALLTALASDRPRHAVLDVFKQEPLPADHAFWSHPKITVTSHSAARTQTAYVVKVFADNYQRFVKGHPLHHQVNFELGY
jgi:phosphoglycerate dehydrogenase-like enzyme